MSRTQVLKALLEQDPEDAFARYCLGLEALSQGELAEATAHLEELRRRQPSYLALYLQLGKAREGLGDLAGAREALEEGLRVAEAARDAHTLGELQDALDALA